MKNIHLQKTDKPSKIGQSVFDKSLHFNPIFNYELEKERVIPQHIYITSDEEIEEGDWFFNPFINEIQISCNPDGCKKIILTTDPDLINDDGVQAIEDEFLEWFVKNPSCEKVEVERGYLGMGGFCKSSEIISKDKIHYKIIIPKEELKQETLEEAAKFYAKIPLHRDVDSEERYFNGAVREYDAFKDGAKWQQERMYSEEEVRKIAEEVRWQAIGNPLEFTKHFDEWFEENKKK